MVVVIEKVLTKDYEGMSLMAIIVTIANQKGGVGKTATTSALAYGLKERGFNVLIIDADGQCNTTDAFQAKIEGQATLYDLMSKKANVKEAIQHTKYIDIIASDYLLKQADKYFDNTGREFLIKEAIAPIKSEYDFIIIDTIPGLGVMLSNALTAADYVLLPMGADRDSLQGLSQLNLVLKQVIQYSNSNLIILGFLITRAKTNASLLNAVKKDILPQIEKQIQAKAYTTVIRENVHVQNARASFMPIIEYQKENKGKDVIAIEDYDSFIDEFLLDLKLKGV